jgi:sigma-B regulation protein RsbU (phosphoserine phosphatase)
MRILIAEDERITRMTLARQLQSWGHDVTAAEDGEQAWERFGAAEFDIVITDWEMPRLSGVELVRRIRGAAGAVYTYVIILTSRSDKSDIVSGIEAGADDFVSKPFDREELRVRLLAGERIIRLERALNQQNHDLREANERIREGLRAAARVQQSMLPKENIVIPHARAAWNYVPTDELAGDAIGLHLVDDRYLVSYVADVSGHGVPAALLAVAAMHFLAPVPESTSLLRDFAHADGSLGTVKHPARVTSDLNHRFCAKDNDGRFLTMILAILDTLDGRLHLTSAGHPPPLLLRGKEIIALPNAGGFPIALMDDAEYDDAVVQLKPGDRVCLCSDGVLEEPNDSDEQFGEDRLRQLLTDFSDEPAGQWVQHAVESLAAWSGSTSFRDDVSLVMLEWLGPGTA